MVVPRHLIGVLPALVECQLGWQWWIER